ncbi:unnamed protein product [Soboliphyme baturini]|uniref:Nuclear cap-binding protein subunit 2 n=1 Tax=Soboliphyme baturini TaxID=241478 RepID=A0A183IW04_9BILA|nr:unnamed protein product [Soboliphyme baturini]
MTSLSVYRDQRFQVSGDRSYGEGASTQGRFQGNLRELERLLSISCTLYVGNMSFYTSEEQVHELFSRAGDVRRIIMGLDRHKKTPCGFCFVE